MEAGYQAFLLTYRVGNPGAVKTALDDLNRAVCYLEEHCQELQVNIRNLVLGGFSAGANLISEWALRPSAIKPMACQSQRRCFPFTPM